MSSSARFGILHILLAVMVAVVFRAERPLAQDGENPYTSRIDERMGRRLYEGQCASCHGLNATGGEEAAGPDLTTGRFRHAGSDAGLFRVIRDGVDGTAMIGLGADASEQAVWQLVTYLRSLDVTAMRPDLPGSAALGQQLFEGKADCVSCHMVNGLGQRLGPDLSTVGDRRTAEELEADLTEPDRVVDPRWWTMRVTRGDDTVIEGLRMSEDTFSFRIMDADQNLRSFSKLPGLQYERVKTSTMPRYDQSLTEQEIDHLVAYLFSLRTER